MCWECKEQKERSDHREHQEMTVIQVRLGQLVPEEDQDLWVCPDLKASVVIQENPEKSDHQGLQDKEDPMEKMEKKVLQEQQDHLE